MVNTGQDRGLLPAVAKQKRKSTHIGTGIIKFRGKACTSAHTSPFPVSNVHSRTPPIP